MIARSVVPALTLLALFAVLSVTATAHSVPYVVRAEATSEAEATPEPSPDSEAVCVDAKYLSKYASHQLVHTIHPRAIALCPLSSTLPCATPDHMIRMNGQRLSYRQLCTSIQCEQKRIAVNSVLSHVWKEENHGEKVVLTMYDARHPEIMQRILHRIIAARRAIVARFN